MDIKVIPKKLDGTLPFIFSKSYMHRIIIASTLAQMEDEPFDCDIFSLFTDEMLCEDTQSTLNACKKIYKGFISTDASLATPLIDCSDSATTLRLLLLVASALFNESAFKMSEQLSKRPIAPLLEILKDCGCHIVEDNASISCFGKFDGGKSFLPNNVSSQFLSGLLFALPLTKNGGDISIKMPLSSAPYICLTCDILKAFGIKISIEKNEDKISFTVLGNQRYKLPKSFANASELFAIDNPLCRDWSLSSLWLVADFLGSSISPCTNDINGTLDLIDAGIHMPDICILEILKHFKTGGTLSHDCDNCPDLVPLLAIAACFRTRDSVTHLINLGRLKYKESNRIKSTVDMIQNLGGMISYTDDSITITSKKVLSGGVVESYSDHRIAMAGIIAATACNDTVTIKDISCIKKSYPNFLRDFTGLGGSYYEL